MPEPTTIQEAIERAAIDGVRSVSSDGTSVTARDIDEMVRAQRFLEERDAAKRRGQWPFRMFRMRPKGPGA